VEEAAGLPVVGYLPPREDLRQPERHLGLVPSTEVAVSGEFLGRLVSQVQHSFDLDKLVTLAGEVEIRADASAGLFPDAPIRADVRLAVAMDRAFGFYYQDSLDLLSAWGADIVPFSPMADGGLPQGVAGVYIGGGFPELFAAELAANEPMKDALRRAAAQGMPIYGECGGLMYLGETLSDFDGQCHAMAGLVPARSAMTRSHLSLGYRTVEACSDGPLLGRGQRVRGHEFHWSVLVGDAPSSNPAYVVTDQGGRLEGFCNGSVLASYIHVHMGANRKMAPSFVEACQRWAKGTRK
jgi:cobyrinic acid a,c-diamide synthase